jgi:hypothetical protein
MARISQNGWPVVGPDQIDNSLVNGHKYPNGFLEGDVFAAFEWLFDQLDKRVEKVAEGTPRDEWGYNVREIEGSNSFSNHSSGTAGDYNASQHGMGGSAHAGYTEKQVDEIHEILREADGIFRWGGDYTGRKDPMHFEIVKSRAAVAAFVQSIKPQGRYKMSVDLDGYALPELHLGDDDAKKAGYNYVQRAQTLLNYVVNAGLKVDGGYGKVTKAAVVKLAAPGNGETIGIAEWAQLLGLAKTK